MILLHFECPTSLHEISSTLFKLKPSKKLENTNNITKIKKHLQSYIVREYFKVHKKYFCVITFLLLVIFCTKCVLLVEILTRFYCRLFIKYFAVSFL